MRRAFLTSVTVLGFFLAPGAAQARDLPHGGMTVEDVASWLQDAGYKAQIQTGKDGAPNIDSSAEGMNFQIYFYDCKDKRCGSIQFSKGYDTGGAFDAKAMNDWTAKDRWVRAFADDVNDPWLEYDVDLTPGGTYELLNDEFKIWRDSLRRFDGVINAKTPGQ